MSFEIQFTEALKKADLEIIKSLIAQAPNLLAVNVQNPLALVLFDTKEDSIEKLLEKENSLAKKQVISYLLSIKPEILTITPKELMEQILIIAIKLGDVELIDLIHKKDRTLIKNTLNQGESVLLVAALNAQHEVIKYLLKIAPVFLPEAQKVIWRAKTVDENTNSFYEINFNVEQSGALNSANMFIENKRNAKSIYNNHIQIIEENLNPYLKKYSLEVDSYFDWEYMDDMIDFCNFIMDLQEFLRFTNYQLDDEKDSFILRRLAYVQTSIDDKLLKISLKDNFTIYLPKSITKRKDTVSFTPEKLILLLKDGYLIEKPLDQFYEKDKEWQSLVLKHSLEIEKIKNDEVFQQQSANILNKLLYLDMSMNKLIENNLTTKIQVSRYMFEQVQQTIKLYKEGVEQLLLNNSKVSGNLEDWLTQLDTIVKLVETYPQQFFNLQKQFKINYQRKAPLIREMVQSGELRHSNKHLNSLELIYSQTDKLI
ncbi:MAG: hypothetical protein JWM09_1018, partial [Francisellaceae bacterium]|nr:hypothetical protein [Francisellaceae bacterium]